MFEDRKIFHIVWHFSARVEAAKTCTFTGDSSVLKLLWASDHVNRYFQYLNFEFDKQPAAAVAAATAASVDKSWIAALADNEERDLAENDQKIE